MKKISWPEHQLSALLSCALFVLVACLPSSATEPKDDEQVSSRKSSSKSPAAAPASPAKIAPSSGELELSASSNDLPLRSVNGSESKTKEAATETKSIGAAKGDGSRDNVLRSGTSKPNDASAKGDDSSGKASHKQSGDKPTKSGDSKSKPGDSKAELSIEAQQNKDQGECPGSEGSKVPASKNLNDVPLEQEDHPFDAPVAKSDEAAAPHKTPARVAKIEKPQATTTVPGLEERINLCLAHYFRNEENLAKRSPWAVMHTILPYGVETNVVAGNRDVNAIGWMCYNGVCKTQRMFQSTNNGFRTNVGPGVQGHEGQFLAVLAQSSVPRSFPIMVGKTRYTVSDLIRYEMITCREKSELTFKLIGLSHYLSPQQTWRDERGHTWNLEKLVREELDQPVVGAACGGTHRLMGLSYALMMRRRYSQPINNHWARADAYIQDFVQYAWTLQNPDGSFSTDWFEGRANEPNMERKVQTTGHILEWLVFTLTDEQLDDPRLAKSVEFLLSQVYDHRENDWPIGPRGHSLRAISLYNQRVYGAPTGQLKSYLAQAGYLRELR